MNARNLTNNHKWVSLGVSIAMLIGVAIWLRARMRNSREFGNTGAFFQLNGKEGILGSAPPNGKVD